MRMKKGVEGMEEKNKNNNLVGKEKETHNFVGLGAIRLWIDLKLLYTVRYNPLRGIKKSCRLGHISPGVFQGVDDQLFFKAFHCFFKRE
jgi:hypothetical protein